MSLGAVSAHQELRPGEVGGFLRGARRSLVSGYNTQHTTQQQAGTTKPKRAQRGGHAPLLARAAGELAPGTEHAGHGRCSAVAAQLQLPGARQGNTERRLSWIID